MMKVKKILQASAYFGIHVTTLIGHLSGLTKLQKRVNHNVLTPLEEEELVALLMKMVEIRHLLPLI